MATQIRVVGSPIKPCLIALFLFALPASTTALAQSPCVPADGTPARVVAVNERTELVFADGRILLLAGIDIARATSRNPKLANLARDTLAAWLVGHTVTIEPMLPSPDRWGRIVGDVSAPADFSAPADPPVSAGWMLVDAGLARTRPVERAPCTSALISAEAAARSAKLGLWADPDYAVIGAGDAVGLAGHAGRFVVVEGDVVRVFTGRTRIFIDFGRNRDSLTAVVSSRSVKRLAAAGVSVKDLAGVRLRIRGILDTRFGPRIEVSSPEEIERL